MPLRPSVLSYLSGDGPLSLVDVEGQLDRFVPKTLSVHSGLDVLRQLYLGTETVVAVTGIFVQNLFHRDAAFDIPHIAKYN